MSEHPIAPRQHSLYLQALWLADEYQRPAYIITDDVGSIRLTATYPDVIAGLEIITVYPTKEMSDVQAQVH